ncbi:MAG: zinc metalloprotease HtpX [Acidobacteriota bacterium]
MNALKTALLLGLLSGLLMFGGQAIAGRQGMMMGLMLAVGMNFFSYFFSEKMALSMYSAQLVTTQENPEIYARVFPIVNGLTIKMGLPMPRLWVIPGDQPNAFATGRNPAHSSVAMTEGILRIMTDRELEGVLAHELGHVLHRDILISSVAATLAAALSQIAYLGMFFGGGRRNDDEDRGSPVVAMLTMLVAPMAAGLIQMAISRSREFDADATSAKYTGSPDGLINALGKLERGVERIPMDANQATAHMFIMNPFRAGGLSRMFSTHPSTEERIARLQEMRLGAGMVQGH